jgi:Flp pilus assembly pilin Flp
MAEYALILALVFTVVLATVAIYGDWVTSLWAEFNSAIGA